MAEPSHEVPPSKGLDFTNQDLEHLRTNGIEPVTNIENELSTKDFPLEKLAATLPTQTEEEQRVSLAKIQKYMEPGGGGLYYQRRVMRWAIAWLPVLHLPREATAPVAQSLVDLAIRENRYLQRPKYDSLDQIDRMNALIGTNYRWLAEQTTSDTATLLRELLLKTAPLTILPQLDPVQLPDSLQLRFANAIDIPPESLRFVSTFSTPWEPGVCPDAETQHTKAAANGNAVSLTAESAVIGVVKKMGNGDPTLLALSDVRSNDRFCLSRGGLYTLEELPMKTLSGSTDLATSLVQTGEKLSLLPLRPTKFTEQELVSMQKSYQDRLV